jgi:hypothetical protein
MKKISILFFALTIALTFACSGWAYEALNGATGVLKYNKEKAYDGYTLFSPMTNSKTTYLIDMEGNVVHKWETQYTPGLYAILLENGNLLRGGRILDSPVTIGGVGGIVQEIDWSGKVVWEYKMSSPTETQHHCFARMPNGNTLILGWEYKSNDEALAKGRDPKSFPPSVFAGGKWHYGFWPDFVREVDKSGKAVWEWHAWDHIGKGPTKLDINYKLPEAVGEYYSNFDWTHFNTLDYNPKTDQVIVNSRNMSETMLIDHKTGQIQWRWGNPCAYGQGECPKYYDNASQQLFGSHHASFLENGNIQIFDNGSERPEGNRSRVVEVDPKTNKIVWEYYSNDSTSFYSYRQGAAQRLPNGNTLITSTQHGHLFEVTAKKEIVWEYVVPIQNNKPVCAIEDGDGKNSVNNMVHRSYRYGKDYPGLKGKDLSKKTPLTDCPEFWKIYKLDK